MRVAIIEDSAMVTRFYAAYLETSAYQPVFYPSTADGVESLGRDPAAVVICPAFPMHQDASAIVTRLKANPRFKDTAFILTASAEKQSLGGDWDPEVVAGVLIKPFTQAGLLEILDRVKVRRMASLRATPLAVVVDDSTMARFVLRREMEALGFEVQEAEDGRLGLAVIRQVTPDLVLTDIEMPNMNGLELCHELASDPHTAQIPIIVISSIVSDAQVRSGFGSGVINFLKKPINPTDLASSVAALLGQQQADRQGNALVVGADLPAVSIIRKELTKVGVFANVCQTEAELEAFLAVCRPDVIVLDTDLPQVHAPDICRKLRSRPELAATPIVITAEERDREIMIHCLHNRADDFLLKPFTQEEFKARITSHLRAKRLHNELMQRNRILESLAYQDGLTGLLNRRYLDEGLARELERALQSGRPLGFLLIDLDHFKRVNDTHGHQVGDDVLRGVATEIQNGIRQFGIACRYGGEEMCVLLPGASLLKAQEVAERLRVACEKRRFTDHKISQTLSVGVSCFPETSTAETLVRDADEAVYQAKAGGRNQVVARRTAV